MSERSRDRFAEVGAAMRQAIARANATDLSDGQRRVFDAVLSLVTSYSRLADRISVADVAAVAVVSRSTAIRALAKLAELEIIVYERSKGGRAAGGSYSEVRSLVGLHPVRGVKQGDTPSPSDDDEARGVKSGGLGVSSRVTPTREGPEKKTNLSGSGETPRARAVVVVDRPFSPSRNGQPLEEDEKPTLEAVAAELHLSDEDRELLRDVAVQDRGAIAPLEARARKSGTPRRTFMESLAAYRDGGWERRTG